MPGHGPVAGEAEVRVLQAYLRACREADGDAAALAGGPWEAWLGAEYHAVNVERAALLARADDRVPDAMLGLLGMA